MGRKSDAKERLIDAAIHLFGQTGYAATPVDALCELARVKKGSFYYFYPSKAALVIAALQRQWERHSGSVEAIYAAPVSHAERLRMYLQWICEWQEEFADQHGFVLGGLYMSIGSEAIRQDGAIYAKVQEAIARYLRYYLRALEGMAQEGLIPRQDLAVKADRLYSYVEGALLRARVQNSLDPLHDLPETAMALLGVSLPTAA